jgi:hypothetical protein
MKKRTRLSTEELCEALKEQLEMLSKSCKDFDHGDVFESKRIAVHLRTLWHNSGQSKGLVSQLNLAKEVIDTAFLVPPTFITAGLPHPPSSERRLFAIGGSRAYAPLFDHGPAGIYKTQFNQWWEGNVLSDGEGHKFTRKDMVLAVANTDGGAHVDPTLDSEYYALTRKETFGIIRVVPTEDPKVFKRIATPSPTAVTLRQIGHETLKSLYPGYNYDGRVFYPGGALFSMSAVITPSTNEPNNSDQ